MPAWIMHIDMDAFFASVEVLDHPQWKGKPLAVAGSSDRSVVSAASYEIRKYGVRSAMSVVQAKKLCPHGLFVPPRMRRYSEVSRQVMAVLRDFSPLVEQASVDEAYLDASGLTRLFGPVEEMAARLKAAVREATGLTCSVGLAPVRFLAKIASDLNKPDGLAVIRPGDMQDFLKTLPIGKIPGVGGATLKTLQSYGVKTAADVTRFPAAFWAERLGAWGPVLWERCQGIDPRGVEPHGEAKSSSAENTFEKDTRDRETLRRWVLVQAERVGADLRAMRVVGRTVTLKAKFADFRQVTRGRTLEQPTDSTDVIYRTALGLLDALNPREPLRLIGVGVSGFGRRAVQLGLFDRPGAVRENAALDKAVDEVRSRFGKAALKRGDILDFEG